MFEPTVTVSDTAPAEGPWFCIKRGQVLMAGDQLPVGADAPIDVGDRTVHLLGLLDGAPARTVQVPDDVDAPDGFDFASLRSLFGTLDDERWVLAGRAEQVLTWDRTHRYCGSCGTETEIKGDERCRTCPSCGSMNFPRLTPAIITLVERDDKILLAHGRQFPTVFYSALAGFVEPGETLEECVHREVHEEVGIKVSDVTYFGSQPWPFPHSIMIGFTAKYASGDLVLQEEEIVDAGWYGADELPPCPIGGMSIAGWLVQSWLDRRSSGEVTSHAAAPASGDDSLDDDAGTPFSSKAPRSGSIWDKTV